MLKRINLFSPRFRNLNFILRVKNQIIRYYFLPSFKISEFLIMVAAIKFPTFPLDISVAIACLILWLQFTFWTKLTS